MSESIQTKKELRKSFLQIRQQLSRKDVEEKSKRIFNRVLKSKEFSDAEVVHTYISIESKNEVNTFNFIETCLNEDKKVIVPKIKGEKRLEHIEITSFNNFKKNKWGVPEPISAKNYPIKDIDLVLVPMVAGDYHKNRLGYGKGFYDRFLSECPAGKLGILYDCQLYHNKLPVESFDIPLDILFTESGRIE